MRNLAFLCCLISATLSAQIEVDSLTYRLSFQKVDSVDLKKQQIKEAAEKWFAVTFVDSKEVIRLSNDNNIIAKGIFKADIIFGKYNVTNTYNFTIDLAYKDGRYRFQVYDITKSAGGLTVPALYKTDLTMGNYLAYVKKVMKGTDLENQTLKYWSKREVKQEQVDEAIAAMEAHKEAIEDNLNSLAISLNNHLLKISQEEEW